MDNIQMDHSRHVASNRTYPIVFLAHDVDIPMNVGSLFRIADALGVEKIYLCGNSVTPPNSKIRKTSRSAEKYVDYEYVQDPLAVIRNLKARGYRIISLEITTRSIDIKQIELDPAEKVCLVLGAENHGVNPEILAASDLTVHIPMMGVNSSMNVAIACSIATYELTRRFCLTIPDRRARR